jgi:hypothetical protein
MLASPQSARRLAGVHGLATANPDPRYLKAFELNKMLLKKMSAKCQQLHARFLLISINLADCYPPKANELRAMDPTFNPNFFDENLAEFAAQNRIEFIGLQRIFTDEYQKNGKHLQWGHWNYDGHRLVARVLADYLAKISFAGYAFQL